LTRFVGRQKELQQLAAVWKQAKAGRGQVVLVSGVPGSGKSRTIQVFLERIKAEVHATLRLQCSPYHVNSPLHPVISELERVSHFAQDDTPEAKLEKLKKALSRAGKMPLAEIALYAALLSIPTRNSYLPTALTPQRQKELTISALVRQALAIAQEKPLVIKLADAHWIDVSTLELFSRIITSTSRGARIANSGGTVLWL
jgi:predicted ATPase